MYPKVAAPGASGNRLFDVTLRRYQYHSEAAQLSRPSIALIAPKNDVWGITMKRVSSVIIFAILASILASCTVISRQRMAEALSDVTFPQLRADTDRYRGQVVILGGHVIEVRNQTDQTVLVILQSPLGSGQEPLPSEHSQGRFILRNEGFLDPEVFSKGRTLTVAGRVIDSTEEAIGQERYRYPVLEALEIYLWRPEEDRYPYYPYYRRPYYDPWYDRRPWRRSPYRW